ncbi:MAG TPA: pyridoxal phosphate-dependent aminotransferase [Coxiellaceae bacterium]|nr:pyridoxal phosphate-dependent aminotransferase [Coxiellaceae bacterium]
MPIRLAPRVNRIQPSPTLALNDKASALKAQGINVINLTVGEPDFDTPEWVKEAAYAAAKAGFTKYSPNDGYPDLKAAIVGKFRHENDLVYEPKQILVSSGAKFSLYLVAQVLLSEGDEWIIPAPYWVSYPPQALIADATPITIETDMASGFKLSPQQLEAAITPRTKLVLLNSPSNPTGSVYSEAELKALGDVLLKHPNIMIVSDDIYEHILWSQPRFKNIVNACPALKERTIVVNGVSKAYAMTGWRIGYAAGPEGVIKAMSKIQSQSTSGACCVAQKAAVAALQGDQRCIQEMRDAYKRRHDLVVQGLNQIPGFHCAPTDGAFYLFPNVEKAISQLQLKDDVAFSEKLLMEAHVAVVPGTDFGAPGYLRFSTATSDELLKEAIAQIQRLLTEV